MAWVTPEFSATTADAYSQGSRRMRWGRQDRTACSIAGGSAATCGPGKGRLSTRRPRRRGVAEANSAQIAPIASDGGPSPRLTAIPAAPARVPVDLVITSSGSWPSAWAAAPKGSSGSTCPGRRVDGQEQPHGSCRRALSSAAPGVRLLQAAVGVPLGLGHRGARGGADPHPQVQVTGGSPRLQGGDALAWDP